MDNEKNIIVIHEDGCLTRGSSKIAQETAIGLRQKGYNVTYFCGTSPIEHSQYLYHSIMK